MEIDTLLIEILEDGTIKTTSDVVSVVNHESAEQFLRGIARLAGGETTREARKDVKHAQHSHAHLRGKNRLREGH
jgi:hypothetical protein